MLQRRTEPFPGRLILQVARAAQAGPRCGILLGRLVEQNPASGVQDCLALRMPDGVADRQSWKGPQCQNSCLLLRYFLPACLLL